MPKRKDTEIPQSSGPTDNVADEVVNEEMDDNLVRAATTASSLEAKQDNEVTHFEVTTKTTQANEIISLKSRVKRLERRNKSRTYGLKRLYKVGLSARVESSEYEGLGEEDTSKHGRIANINANKDIYLVNVHTDEDMFGVNDLDRDEVIFNNEDVVKTVKETRSVVEEVTTVIEKAKLVSVAEETVNVAATTVSTASTIPVSVVTTTTTTTVITDDEITLAKALTELKSAKPPTQGITFRNPREKHYPTVSFQQPSPDLSCRSASLPAKVEANYQLAQRLQAQEQEELTDEEKAILFVQFLEQRRKHFIARGAGEEEMTPKVTQRSISVDPLDRSLLNL
ncbi:hypothetical protein Tco_0319765 [Tanacetum coccineum]